MVKNIISILVILVAVSFADYGDDSFSVIKCPCFDFISTLDFDCLLEVQSRQSISEECIRAIQYLMQNDFSFLELSEQLADNSVCDSAFQYYELQPRNEPQYNMLLYTYGLSVVPMTAQMCLNYFNGTSNHLEVL